MHHERIISLLFRPKMSPLDLCVLSLDWLRYDAIGNSGRLLPRHSTAHPQHKLLNKIALTVENLYTYQSPGIWAIHIDFII